MPRYDTSERRSPAWRVALLMLALSARAWAGDSVVPDDVAQRVAEAEVLAERAYAAYSAHDYTSAVTLYHQAFERAPSADALFNIARVYDLGLRDRELAIRFYRRYLGDPGASPDRIQRANQRLAELRLAEEARLAPAAPAVGSTSMPAPAAEVEREDGLSGWRVAALASGVSGAVALGLGTVFGVTVLSDAKRANADCNGNTCQTQTGVDAARAASRHATLATLGVAAGTGLMATGALLWLLDPGARDEADVRVEPVASSAELGLSLEGRW